MKKAISLLTALLLAAAPLTACSETKENSETTPQPASVTPTLLLG